MFWENHTIAAHGFNFWKHSLSETFKTLGIKCLLYKYGETLSVPVTIFTWAEEMGFSHDA